MDVAARRRERKRVARFDPVGEERAKGLPVVGWLTLSSARFCETEANCVALPSALTVKSYTSAIGQLFCSEAHCVIAPRRSVIVREKTFVNCRID